MIPSEQAIATPPAHVPSMRPSPHAEVISPGATPPRRSGRPLTLAFGALCGVLGLLVAPVLLGPAAIAGGFAGELVGSRDARGAGAVAVLVAVVGGLVTALALR